MKAKRNKRMSRAGIVFLIGLIIIIIPVAIYGAILYKAIADTGQPIVGHRFDNDLKPAIESAQVDSLKAQLLKIDDVEDVAVNLVTGQLRILIDVKDETDEERITAICTAAYQAVDESLPIATYFTATDTMRMYDLSIGVYNHFKRDDNDETMIFYELIKNAKMAEASTQLLSKPVDPDLVESMYKEIKEAEEKADAEGEASAGEETGE